ncbi:hypothetical protein N0V88_005123 [Collariella sp. IMI 366227]|nr:hypothetical protein N0V88_005123 [Collariella sp. IMI 366227]
MPAPGRVKDPELGSRPTSTARPASTIPRRPNSRRRRLTSRRTAVALTALALAPLASTEPTFPYTPTTVLLPLGNGTLAYIFTPSGDSPSTVEFLSLNISSLNGSPKPTKLTSDLPFLAPANGNCSTFAPSLLLNGTIAILAGDCSSGSSSSLWTFTPSPNTNPSWTHHAINPSNGWDHAQRGPYHLSGMFSFSAQLKPTLSDPTLFLFGGIGLLLTELTPSVSNRSGSDIVTQHTSHVLLGGHTQNGFVNMSTAAVWSMPEETWSFVGIAPPPAGKGRTDLMAAAAAAAPPRGGKRDVVGVDSRSGHTAVLSEDGTRRELVDDVRGGPGPDGKSSPNKDEESSNSDGSTRNMQIGLGVGLSFGLLILLSLAALGFRWYRQKQQRRTDRDDTLRSLAHGINGSDPRNISDEMLERDDGMGIFPWSAAAAREWYTGGHDPYAQGRRSLGYETLRGSSNSGPSLYNPPPPSASASSNRPRGAKGLYQPTPSSAYDFSPLNRTPNRIEPIYEADEDEAGDLGQSWPLSGDGDDHDTDTNDPFLTPTLNTPSPVSSPRTPAAGPTPQPASPTARNNTPTSKVGTPTPQQTNLDTTGAAQEEDRVLLSRLHNTLARSPTTRTTTAGGNPNPSTVVVATGTGQDEWERDIERAAQQRTVQIMFTVPREPLRVVNAEVEREESVLIIDPDEEEYDAGDLGARKRSPAPESTHLRPPRTQTPAENKGNRLSTATLEVSRTSPSPSLRTASMMSETLHTAEAVRLERPRTRVLAMVDRLEGKSRDGSPAGSPVRGS